ncbi:MAG TPA: MFS transporter [Dehalococcoidia bacterium]|nr:MFS transporter [Dehalococcoidia bacterium]
MPSKNNTNYRWYALTLSASIFAFAAMMPEMCMSVLFEEISQELNLSLVQLGTIWGIVPLGSTVFLLASGAIGDRFGVKRTVTIACLLAGIAGASRGLATSFTSLLVTSFLSGLMPALISISLAKATHIWFPNRQLGFVNGIIVTGGGLGTVVGSMISATFLSPLLGGWRHVLFLYGAIAIVLSIIWFLTIKETRHEPTTVTENTVPIGKAMLELFRIKALWLLSLSYAFYMGALVSIAGYLPLYLKRLGWSGFSADGALSALNLAATVGGIPLTLLSDRIGRRKTILMTAMVISVIGASLLPVAVNTFVFVWVIVIAMGAFRSAYQALSTTVCLESEFAGAEYTGIATGFLFTINRLAAFAFPPTGNSLAEINIGLPFVYWAALFAIGLLILTKMKETGWKARSRQ